MRNMASADALKSRLNLRNSGSWRRPRVAKHPVAILSLDRSTSLSLDLVNLNFPAPVYVGNSSLPWWIGGGRRTGGSLRSAREFDHPERYHYVRNRQEYCPQGHTSLGSESKGALFSLARYKGRGEVQYTMRYSTYSYRRFPYLLTPLISACGALGTFHKRTEPF